MRDESMCFYCGAKLRWSSPVEHTPHCPQRSSAANVCPGFEGRECGDRKRVGFALCKPCAAAWADRVDQEYQSAKDGGI